MEKIRKLKQIKKANHQERKMYIKMKSILMVIIKRMNENYFFK